MITNKLSDLLRYYDVNRRVGHTTLMVEGIGSAEEPFLLLAHEQGYAERILRDTGKRSIGIPLSWASLQGHRLQGLRAPLAIDNSAMMHILNDCLELVLRQEEIINVRVAHHTRAIIDEKNEWIVRHNELHRQLSGAVAEVNHLENEGVFAFAKRKIAGLFK